MNLPLVFDIALGLIFIYLILSLLSSEVQELIATLLQWRAEHLKKSIEILITGDSDENGEGISFADQLYNKPLLRSLNQEAKGPFARFFRGISQRIGQTYRWITRTRNTFGFQKSGPSYIPSTTFAAALLEDLNIKEITHQKSCDVLRESVEDKLNRIQVFLDILRKQKNEPLLAGEFEDLRYRINMLQDDFAHRQLSFSVAMGGVISQVNQFLENTQAVLAHDADYQLTLNQQLPYLKQAIAVQPLEPTIADVVRSTIENNPAIPRQLRQNLISLAQEAQTQANELANEISQFEESVAKWFDRAMDRSSGVYKRNAKGIAFILGVIIAIVSNTDTFYILTRLSQDSTLRSTIVGAAEQLANEQSTLESGAVASTTGSGGDESVTEQLGEVKDAVQVALEDIPLPLGWTPQITEQQQKQAKDWRFPFLRRILGWLVTGIALSMGASFWYGIIGKIIDVRNAGGSKS
ncbi:MAG: hypothetical protein AAGD25_32405 [Cyanobacteria bacterium P01_F01_bin.150]